MIHEKIKNTRNKLGLSQQKLAELSGLSIATIQCLESSKSNPTWDVLNRVLKVLSCDVQISPEKINWQNLSDYGLGIAENLDSTEKREIWDKKKFVKLIISACLSLENSNATQERERVALEALIFAVKNHYPSFFMENLDIPIVKKFLPSDFTGKHLKLYRYSKKMVSRFL